MVDAELAAPAGIQFPDGRMIDCDEWPAYDEANRRRRRMEDERAARKTEPPPTRKVSAPFGGGEVEVEAGTPEWLGVRSGESGG